MKKLLFILLLLWVMACKESGRKGKQTDKFYTDQGDFDLGRIPLIKPYEAIVVTPGHNWFIKSIDTNDVPFTIPQTREVRVTGNIILAHGLNTILDGQPIKEAWFVIIPKDHIIKGFTAHQEYLEFINHQGFRKEPKLYDINKVSNEFYNNGFIDWNKM